MPPTPLLLNLALFALGLYIIIKGSDLFLDSAVWIARASGVSQLIIGATVVSLCTTLPELVSSCTASIKGAVDMALGNAIGSVVCNTGFILGGILMFIVARAKREIYLIKGIFMLGTIATALLLLMKDPSSARPPQITRAEGCVLLIVLVIYLVVNYYESIHTVDPPLDPDSEEPPPATPDKQEWTRHGVLFAVGAFLVTVGAYLLIEFGQRLARDFGVKEAVISLVFVAFGTSLPELFTAISAVRKKASQISIGNIFGANVLNIGLVTGASATIRPLIIDDQFLLRFDVPVALVLCTVAFVSGVATGRMGKRTGYVLLTFYGAYLASMLLLGRVG